jgi:superfamily II DNA or RNA helicase
MLNELKLEVAYRSDRQNLISDFYEPCLFRSRLYRRAVGYFSSYGLANASAGIAALVVNNGRVQLAASPHLSADDATALQQGYADRKTILREICQREFRDVRDSLVRDRLSALAWLVAKGVLDVKLALRVTGNGAFCRGIYHEKMGIFEDEAGHRVAFSGSSNETQGGLVDNFEAVDVYWSWEDPQRRVARKLADFGQIWQNDTASLDIIDFSDATADLLSAYRNDREPDWEAMVTASVRQHQPKSPANKWRHQDKAVAEFLARERGILEMATGTGKTKTALKICAALLERKQVETIIVAADGIDLLDQWRGQLIDLTTRLNRRFALYRHYAANHDRDRFNLNPANSILLVSRLALPSALKHLSKETAAKTILIHDEAHRVGSAGNRTELAGTADTIRFRLGLSATPDREYDAEGNLFIEQHIGPVLFRFGLEEAIREGILAPFTYHPLPYQLDADDRRRLHQIFARRTARQQNGNPMSDEEFWTELAKVHKTSRAKLPVFEQFLTTHAALLANCIVFVETKEYGESVLEIIHKHRHDFHTYYGDEDASVLRQFARGDIACLVTCHRLSEGIDIRSLETVILFSSARARLETIQRIGRCLRVDPENPAKRANVVDFVRQAQPGDQDPESDEQRSQWLADLSAITPRT